MDWLISVVADLAANQQTFQDDNQALLRTLDELKERLHRVESNLDEQVLRGMRTGIRHLVDGLNSDLPDVRDDELRLARAEFTRLASLNPEGQTAGQSGVVDNSLLISLGYWGNAHYFNMRGDTRNALLQVYECTRKHPEYGLLTFSSQFFSRDYLTEFVNETARLALLSKQLEQREWGNLFKGITNFGKQVVKGVVALGAGVIIGSFSGPLGLMAAGAVWNSEVEVEQYEDTDKLKADIQQATQKIQTALADLERECDTRIADLQKVTLKDLAKIKPNNPKQLR
ncbi:MAG: hypothetical protein IT323_17080 [Anaerolineae bacterium]|nr:hypothetical protein [Anaerolineae bacterium]